MSELPAGWTTTTLGEVCDKPQYGWTTKADPDGSGLKLVRTTDITRGPIKWSSVPYCSDVPADPSKYLLHPGDLLISRSGSVGVSALVESPEPAVFASYLVRLRAVSDVEPRYVGWFLKSPGYWQQIAAAAAGIALQNVNAKKLAAIAIPLPPGGEQHRIVAAIEEQFSRLDAAEESLCRARQRLGALAAGQADHLFNGDATQPLAEALEFLADCPHRTPKYVPDGVPALRPRDVVHGELDLEGAARVEEAEYALQTRRNEPRGGDVVYSRELSFGWAAAVPNGARLCLSQGMVLFRPAPQILAGYLVAFLNSPTGRRQSERAAVGTAHPHINLRDIREYRVPVPPIEDQHRVLAEVDRQLSNIDAIEAAIDAALKRSTALRRAILDRAFRGTLVPQDPSDEPPSVLLDRIAQKRASDQLKRARKPVARGTRKR